MPSTSDRTKAKTHLALAELFHYEAPWERAAIRSLKHFFYQVPDSLLIFSVFSRLVWTSIAITLAAVAVAYTIVMTLIDCVALERKSLPLSCVLFLRSCSPALSFFFSFQTKLHARWGNSTIRAFAEHFIVD